MAGIGFRLQKLLQKGNYRSLLEAYLYSALVAAGPWLLAILGLGVLGLLSQLFLNLPQVMTFRVIVIYVFAASLILTGPLQLGTTRYIADRLFVNDVGALAPCYHYVTALALIASGGVGALYMAFADLSLASRAAGVVMLQAVSVVWVGMLFLSAAKDYMAIVRAFALGNILGVVAALSGAAFHALPGALWGYALGQVSIALLLGVRVRAEFPSDHAHDDIVVEHWRALPWLMITGLCYNLGIWIDKILFWFSDYGTPLAGVFYASAQYDTCMFLGYLTIVPSMALFLIRIETGFYKQYAAYYQTITQGGSLQQIDARRAALIDALRLSVIRLLKLQGGVTLLAVVLAPSLVAWMGLSPDHTVLLRIALLAACAQIFLMLLLIVLLYFDWQRDVAMLCIFFLISNAALTYASLMLDPRFHGFGYLLSALLTLGSGLITLERRLRSLSYSTFSREALRS